MMGWVLAALAAIVFSQGGGNSSSSSGGTRKKYTTGTAPMKAGLAYRIELEVTGAALQANPVGVAQGIDNGLRMAGAYDVLIQPTFPLLVSYSFVPAGDLPVVLNVPVQQTIGGVPGLYTFKSIQQIDRATAAA